MGLKKEKSGGDVTSTARGLVLLERLKDSNGKRVVVDLGSIDRVNLEELVSIGYADNQSAVIRKAIGEAAKRQRRRS